MLPLESVGLCSMSSCSHVDSIADIVVRIDSLLITFNVNLTNIFQRRENKYK